MSGPNRIDPTPVRISTNVSIDRQTPKTDFGDRVKTGLDAAAGAVANGAAVAAPFIPGGAIVSAAVSSVSSMSNGSASGQAMNSRYASTGVVSVGSGAGGINTTVGGGGLPIGGGSTLPIGGATLDPGSANSSLTNSGPVGSGGTLSDMNAYLNQTVQQNAQLMQVQMKMQNESQVYQSVSNVLKVRHDTVKNTIQNVR